LLAVLAAVFVADALAHAALVLWLRTVPPALGELSWLLAASAGGVLAALPFAVMGAIARGPVLRAASLAGALTLLAVHLVGYAHFEVLGRHAVVSDAVCLAEIGRLLPSLQPLFVPWLTSFAVGALVFVVARRAVGVALARNRRWQRL